MSNAALITSCCVLLDDAQLGGFVDYGKSGGHFFLDTFGVLGREQAAEGADRVAETGPAHPVDFGFALCCTNALQR